MIEQPIVETNVGTDISVLADAVEELRPMIREGHPLPSTVAGKPLTVQWDTDGAWEQPLRDGHLVLLLTEEPHLHVRTQLAELWHPDGGVRSVIYQDVGVLEVDTTGELVHERGVGVEPKPWVLGCQRTVNTIWVVTAFLGGLATGLTAAIAALI